MFEDIRYHWGEQSPARLFFVNILPAGGGFEVLFDGTLGRLSDASYVVRIDLDLDLPGEHTPAFFLQAHNSTLIVGNAV